MSGRTQEQYLADAAEKRRQEKAAAEAKLRTLCDGTRTVREIASRMGWTWDKAQQNLKRLGLKAEKEAR